MNVGDSEIVVSIMQEEGYRYTEELAEADIVLINTCSIRDNAEQRGYGDHACSLYHSQLVWRDLQGG